MRKHENTSTEQWKPPAPAEARRNDRRQLFAECELFTTHKTQMTISARQTLYLCTHARFRMRRAEFWNLALLISY